MSRDFFQVEKPAQKKKVDLHDYDYLSDIQIRSLMAKLNRFEIEVLQEIIDSSLNFSINQLAEILETAPNELIPVLDKFSDLQLLQQREDKVAVNKEKRRHFELELAKFDEDFHPDISYVFSLLKNKVPIHVLPNWYSISKTASDMFLSIVEKYFATPELYKKYLSTLSFDRPEMDFIISEIFKAPNCRIKSDDVMAKYQLSHGQFQEMVLFLEYTFVGYLCYEFTEDRWVGYICPFLEWREFYERQQTNFPQKLENASVKTRSHEFPFLRDMTALLRAALKSPIVLEGISFETLSGCLPGFSDEQNDLHDYFHEVMEKCLALNLGVLNEERFAAADAASSWIGLVPQDQAVMLYRHPENQMEKASKNRQLYSPTHIRAAEKTLRDVMELGWVLFDEFIQSATHPITQSCGVALTRKGCKWHYSFPEYAADEIQLIYDTIFERLFQCGMVDIGTCREKPCFKVTPFGQSILL